MLVDEIGAGAVVVAAAAVVEEGGGGRRKGQVCWRRMIPSASGSGGHDNDKPAHV
jgi:hypothetical protein